MRVLSRTERNELIIQDAMSGGELRVYYRTPTSRDRAGYLARSVVREKNKVKLNHFEARQVYGMKILTAIGEGDFGVPTPDGGAVAISSDPKSPHYLEDWKALVEEHAADVVQTLGFVVFEGTRAGGGDLDIEDGAPAGDGEEDEAGADAPLGGTA